MEVNQCRATCIKCLHSQRWACEQWHSPPPTPAAHLAAHEGDKPIALGPHHARAPHIAELRGAAGAACGGTGLATRAAASRAPMQNSISTPSSSSPLNFKAYINAAPHPTPGRALAQPPENALRAETPPPPTHPPTCAHNTTHIPLPPRAPTQQAPNKNNQLVTWLKYSSTSLLVQYNKCACLPIHPCGCLPAQLKHPPPPPPPTATHTHMQLVT